MQFFQIGNRMINAAYIKEISPGKIVIANTEMISFAMSGGNSGTYSSAQTNWREKKDEVIQITTQIYNSIIEQLNYPARIDRLSKENERLKLELQYRPGGPGYNEAKVEFETLNK